MDIDDRVDGLPEEPVAMETERRISER